MDETLRVEEHEHCLDAGFPTSLLAFRRLWTLPLYTAMLAFWVYLRHQVSPPMMTVLRKFGSQSAMLMFHRHRAEVAFVPPSKCGARVSSKACVYPNPGSL
ncbi:hypothetical protein AVEN_225298-1 [Araneus ventricosus]|uniref:Uncharacterized protein n=1 Tax=Araneus ventricosus TaxID=182803 RepID=A0A4Y2ANP6_ARAVE|nr:hypothetical protein AVEN_225298-1 [Araneus ventricosus]